MAQATINAIWTIASVSTSFSPDKQIVNTCVHNLSNDKK